MRGGRRSIPRALSPTAPHRILTPASGGRLTGRKAMPRARSGAFWCHFRLGCSPSCPAPSLINANRPSCRVCRLQRRRSALEAPCPLVCLVCRPGGRPTFSCDPEAHAVRERPSSASAHAPGGASLYNGEMARFLGLSSAGDVSVLGRPASVMRARRTACTYPSAAKAHTACCCVRIYMEGDARIYVNGQLPGPLSVHAPPLLI